MPLLAALVLVVACGLAAEAGGPILDTAAQRPVAPEVLVAALAEADLAILGEIHDNAEHHRLQNEMLLGLIGRGRRPALLMEQFDREHQTALEAAQSAPGASAESVAQAGRFDRRAWDWPAYKPLIETALAHGLPVVAANLSRAEARRVVSGGVAALGDPALASAVALIDTPARRAALEMDIIEGHCGHRFAAPILAGMVAAQQARDALMAQIATQAALHAGRRGAVLITGSGHARKDRGVPAYLPPGLRTVSLAFVETATPEAGSAAPASGAESIYDYVWPTAAAPRTDPCLAFRKPAAR